MLDFVLGFGAILILLFLVPATIVVGRTWMEASPAISRITRARSALIAFTLGYVAARHALAGDDWSSTLRGLARQFIAATLVTVPGVIIAGLLLALVAVPHRRRALRLLLAGPIGVGPLTSIAGTLLICLYCVPVAGRFGSTRAGIAAALEGIAGQVAAGLVAAVLMFLPAVGIFTGAATVAITNLFNTGAAHPLLPALVGPWFLTALIVASGGPRAVVLLAVGLPVAIALSVAEVLLVRRDLGVGFRTGPPGYTVEYGKGRLIRGPRGIWQPLAPIPAPAGPAANGAAAR